MGWLTRLKAPKSAPQRAYSKGARIREPERRWANHVPTDFSEPGIVLPDAEPEFPTFEDSPRAKRDFGSSRADMRRDSTPCGFGEWAISEGEP